MCEKKEKKLIDEMKKFTKQISGSADKSKRFLIKAGISNSKGQLVKSYK